MDKITNKNETIQQENRVNKLHFIPVLVEASHLINGLKWPILKRILLIFCLISIILIVQLGITGYLRVYVGLPNFLYQLIDMVTKIITVIVGMNFWVPVLMMGVRQAIGLPIDLKLIELECSKVKFELFKLIVIYAVITTISSFILKFLSGEIIYWIICRFVWRMIVIVLLTPITFFAFPLIITQKLTFYSALISAYKKTYKNWVVITGSIVTLYILIFSIIGVLYSFSLYHPSFRNYVFFAEFILLLFLMPMVTTMGGVLFRDTYGLKKK